MTITINSETYHLPESWNDLALHQQIACYLIIMEDTPSLFTLQESMPWKRMRLVQYLLKLDEKFMRLWEKDCIQAHGKEQGPFVFHTELEELLQCTNFLFEEVEQADAGAMERAYAIKLGLTKCPWPELEREDGTMYYAPADELANISFYEMCTAFTIFEDYIRDQDLALVDRLLATLYRSGKPSTDYNLASGYEGDRRLPLLKHESTVDDRVKYMQRLGPTVKQLMLFWFASCRAKIISDYSALFSQAAGDQSNDPGFGWGGVLMAMAKDVTSINDVAAQAYSDVLTYLLYMDHQRKQAELERKMNRQR